MDEARYWVSDAGRAELLRLAGTPLPGVAVKAPALKALTRAGLIEELPDGSYRLLDAGRAELPEPVFAELQPGDQVVLEDVDHSPISGVVIETTYEGHQVTLMLDDPFWRDRNDGYEARSWEGYYLLQVNSPGRLLLSRADNGSLALKDMQHDIEISDLSIPDLTSLIVQLHQHMTPS